MSERLALPVKPTEADCCAPDCCAPDVALDLAPEQVRTFDVSSDSEVKSLVREKYGALAVEHASCCGSSCCGEAELMALDYSDLEGYVPEADLNLGCGLPTEHAGMRRGDVVLDLGSGAGNDVFVAARVVGTEGRVVGVDMTPEMIDLARSNAEKIGADNTSFMLGDIEALPLDDASVDVVVSNCVLNLVPDKRKAFSEIHRVLRPGGHFCISDIVVEGELPESVLRAAELYVGCVSGAIDRDAYLAIIRETGFEHIDVPRQRRIAIPDELVARYLSDDEAKRYRTSGARVLSVTVRGYRPQRKPKS